MVGRSKPTTPADAVAQLDAILPNIFQSAQTTTANHRKNVALLHKHFIACSEQTTTMDDKRVRLSGEKAFADAFKSAVERVLPVKRGVVQADRVVQFVAAFVKFAVETAAAPPRPDATDDEPAEDDTAASRFISILIKHLLKGFPAKDKNVRFRSCQLVALMISQIGELDDDVFQLLQHSLLDRVRDKESTVRVHAVVALAKLQSAIGQDDDVESEDSVIGVLLDVMEHDPSAEVRRAVTLQIEVTPTTLPGVLQRARDVDPTNRKAAYFALLGDGKDEGHAGITIDILSSAARDEIVRSGLSDREMSVKKAAASVICKWAVDVEGDLVEFLKRFDIVQSRLAEEALMAVFEHRKDLYDLVEFGEEFWSNLSPESAFLARVFASRCRSTNDETRLEECLPVVTALAFRMERVINSLAVSAEPDADAASVLRELLGLAMLMDYADENGRRKMYGLIREVFAHPTLPLDLIAPCLDVLLKLSSGERDFMQVVVEVVQTIREDANIPAEATTADEDEEEDDDDDVVAEALMTPARAKVVRFPTPQALEAGNESVHLRCLAIVRSLLERMLGSLQDNATLIGLVHELIVPAVRSKEPQIREQGMICLGLCSLLDKSMALDSFGLYVNQTQSAEGELQVRVYQIIFDTLMLYGVDFLESRGHGADRVIDFLLHALEQEPEVQAVAAVGIAKLMLAGMVTDSNVLCQLVLVYFTPETIDNQELRQCLSYFFPAYCYSSSANQSRMREILLPSLEILTGVYNEAEDPDGMVPPSQIARQLIDWTDPSKAVETPGLAIDEDVHLDIAIDLMKALYREEGKEDRKLFCQLLGRLYISDAADDWKLRAVLLLVDKLQLCRPLADATSRTTLAKFETGLKKRFADRIETLPEEELAQAEQLDEHREYVELWRKAETGEGNDEDEYVADVAVRSPVKRKSIARAKPARARSTSTMRSNSTAPSLPDDNEEDMLPQRRSTRPRRSAHPKVKVEEQLEVQREIAALVGSESEDEMDLL